MECLFCDIINGKKPAFFIHKDKRHVVFLDKYPIDVGHSLLITRKHYQKITDMPDDEVGELFSKVPNIAKKLLLGLGADAFSLGQNNGAAAKQIIPHVHIHIIPRYNKKGAIWNKRYIAKDEDLTILSQKLSHLFDD
jgi:histidine triad (HIT) family protein